MMTNIESRVIIALLTATAMTYIKKYLQAIHLSDDDRATRKNNLLVIYSSYAVVEPFAVMIEIDDALVALPAVFGRRVPETTRFVAMAITEIANCCENRRKLSNENLGIPGPPRRFIA